MNRNIAVTAVALVAAGCCGAAADGEAGSPPGFGHVHGLGLNPADGRVYAATHYGVFRLDPGGTERITDRLQDTMGFTIAAPDVFLGSGHPDPRAGGPRHSRSPSAPRCQTRRTRPLPHRPSTIRLRVAERRPESLRW